MESCSEEALLRSARSFDQTALAEIYDCYNQGIYYYALRFLGDPMLAEDCTAETFSRFLRALRGGGGPTENLKGYLYRSAHNWITDYYRREPVPAFELSDGLPGQGADDPFEQAELRIIQRRVRTALRLLTPDQRQVILLRFVEGWDLAEVAASLDKPAGAVKALQHRAIAALRKMLVEEEESNHDVERRPGSQIISAAPKSARRNTAGPAAGC
jgi:RNA polymerase sigma-70 factor, ECF subfamily